MSDSGPGDPWLLCCVCIPSSSLISLPLHTLIESGDPSTVPREAEPTAHHLKVLVPESDIPQKCSLQQHLLSTVCFCTPYAQAGAPCLVDVFSGGAEGHSCWLLGKCGLGTPSAGLSCTQALPGGRPPCTWFPENATLGLERQLGTPSLTFSFSDEDPEVQCISSPVTMLCQALGAGGLKLTF